MQTPVPTIVIVKSRSPPYHQSPPMYDPCYLGVPSPTCSPDIQQTDLTRAINMEHQLRILHGLHRQNAMRAEACSISLLTPSTMDDTISVMASTRLCLSQMVNPYDSSCADNADSYDRNLVSTVRVVPHLILPTLSGDTEYSIMPNNMRRHVMRVQHWIRAKLPYFICCLKDRSG